MRLAPQGRQAMRAPCCDRVVPVLGPCWGPGLRPVGPERLAKVVLAGARLLRRGRVSPQAPWC